MSNQFQELMETLKQTPTKLLDFNLGPHAEKRAVEEPLSDDIDRSPYSRSAEPTAESSDFELGDFLSGKYWTEEDHVGEVPDSNMPAQPPKDYSSPDFDKYNEYAVAAPAPFSAATNEPDWVGEVPDSTVAPSQTHAMDIEANTKAFVDRVKTQANEELNGNGSPKVQAATNQKWWQLLGGAMAQVGKPLSMSFEAFSKLSPSTKVALIGAAGTVFAYNQGWKKTAGDVAQTAAGLYGDLAATEMQTDAAARAAEAKADADKAKNQKDLTDYTADDHERVREQLTYELENDPKFKQAWTKFGEEEVRNKKIFELKDKYFQFLAGNQYNMTQYPISKFLEDYRGTEEYQSLR